MGKPLSDVSLQTHIPALQSRGVTVEFILTPTTLLKISGTVTESDNLLIVEVRDSRNRPVEGVPVTFTVISGGGTLSVTNTTTGANGRAESRLTLGPNAGRNRVRANVEGLSQTVTFIDASKVVVNIPDPNLRAAIEKALGKASGAPITTADMANLTELRAPNADITNLTGLEGATNLTRLELGGRWGEEGVINSNSVSNLSPLSGLTNLTNLNLHKNSVSDVSPLSELTNLTDLNLDSNSVSNLSPLSGLTNLTSLSLQSNSISDISPLAELTNLLDLDLWNNPISDISPLAELTQLVGLSIGNNSISDISALFGLTNLRTLFLGSNLIADLSPLVANTGLGDGSTVYVWGNPLNYASIYTHIPALQSRGVEVEFDDQASAAKVTLTGHTDNVWSVVFSPDGTMLASGSWDQTVRLWDVETEQLLHTLTGHTSDVMSVAFSPDGFTLASGSWDGTIRLWNPHTGTLKRTLTDHRSGIRSVMFSPDGQLLASGSQDLTIRLWNTITWQAERTLMGHTEGIGPVAFSPDGQILASAADDGVRLWSVSTGQVLHTLTGHTNNIARLAFSPDGSTLASGANDGVRLWDTHTGVHKTTLTPSTPWLRPVRFSPDGRTLAIGGQGISLWDTATEQYKQPLAENIGDVVSLAYNRNGTMLASGSTDHTIRLWETPSTIVEYVLSIPAGISLIHLPLKVTAVDGVPNAITSIGDLYDALGGAENVSFLVTHDPQAPAQEEWRSYLGASGKGTPADATLTDDKGIIVSMKTPTSIRLSGTPLGTGGTSTITLHPGLNVVGLPLNDSAINRVSDLLALDGIKDNVRVIILSDNGEFKTVGRAGDPGDIEVTGGGAFILRAEQAATVTISGEGWTNVSGTTAAPLVRNADLHSLLQRDMTPVLVLRGAIVDEATRFKVEGFRVTVKNLSTDRAVTGMTRAEEGGYQLTVVEIETGRAAQIGDTLEITAQSPNPFIGVESLRYTITAEDVKRSLIQLPELVVYEIPAATELLRNYPNPFNPETWIPYRLAEDAFVTLTIYDGTGHIVRTLDVGHQIAAVYESRSKAIYWDGRNEVGESVASGVYFYHLSAGDYSAIRKMVILK